METHRDKDYFVRRCNTYLHSIQWRWKAKNSCDATYYIYIYIVGDHLVHCAAGSFVVAAACGRTHAISHSDSDAVVSCYVSLRG